MLDYHYLSAFCQVFSVPRPQPPRTDLIERLPKNKKSLWFMNERAAMAEQQGEEVETAAGAPGELAAEEVFCQCSMFSRCLRIS